MAMAKLAGLGATALMDLTVSAVDFHCLKKHISAGLYTSIVLFACSHCQSACSFCKPSVLHCTTLTVSLIVFRVPAFLQTEDLTNSESISSEWTAGRVRSS